MDKKTDGPRLAKALQFNLGGHSGEKVMLSGDVNRWWWDALEPFPIEFVEKAFLLHARRSHHKPAPADIIKIINEKDGRPNADEAWPMVLKAADENASVTWTDEMRQAWGHAQPVMDKGDEVGARMAFRQHYNRLVEQSRSDGVRVSWSVSLGHDPELREMEVNQAEQRGLIGRNIAKRLMPSTKELEGDGKHIAGLVGYDGDQPAKDPSEKFKENMARLRDAIAVPIGREVRTDEARQAEEARREELQRQEETLRKQRENKK